MLEFMEKGGPLMWPIFACSIAALAIIVDRSIFFLRIRLHFNAFVEELVGLLSAKDFGKALNVAREGHDPSAVIATSYLESMDFSPALREDVLDRVGGQQVERVEARLRMLGAIAHVTPLLGLCGTVMGMINAFRTIEELRGQADVEALARGIWEALLTTAAGLLVAIPAVMAYHAFEALADRTATRMSRVVSIFNETLGIDPTGKTTVEASPAASPEGEGYATL